MTSLLRVNLRKVRSSTDWDFVSLDCVAHLLIAHCFNADDRRCHLVQAVFYGSRGIRTKLL